MKLRGLFMLLTLGLVAINVGCSPSSSSLKKTLEENPEIVFNVIEKHPKKFIDVVNKAATDARRVQQEQAQQQEEKRMEDEFKNPKKPEVADNRAIFGNKNAPITIVEYSDFECPYCARGFNTVEKVLEEYGDKVRVIYKHLPLDFHPMAMPAAKYYEAVALQSTAKAKKFHDEIFKNQSQLKSGREKFLKKTAKKVGADMNKVMKDLESAVVKERIAADMAEAKKYDFSGTPGFLVNGVSLRGAFPFPEFKKIIDRHLEQKQN